MLEVSITEFLIRGLPESLLFILGVCLFSYKAMNLKDILKTTILLAISIFVIRLLPINFGVHTILSLFAFILISIFILKIDFVKSIKSCVLVFIIQFICEGLNIFIVQKILNEDIKKIFNTPINIATYGSICHIIFAVILLIFYLVFYKKKVIKKG